MLRSNRRNSALKFYLNGKAAKSLSGLTDPAGRVLSAFDTAVQRASIGLKRRAGPAVSRAVRENFSIKRNALSGQNLFRIEEGTSSKGDYLSIWASTRKLSLIEFDGRWGGPKTPGATASIEKGRPQTYTGAFIAPGHIRGKPRPVIYSRIRGEKKVVKYGRYKGKLREPIRQLRGPSPFEMVSGVGGYPAPLRTHRTILAELSAFYINELQRQFKLAR